MTTPQPDPLTLYHQPAALGQRGAQARLRAFGEAVWVREAPACPTPKVAALLRDDGVTELAAWPEPQALAADDRVVVQVPVPAPDRARYVAWLQAVAAAAPKGLAIAPTSPTPGGLHRLWCIAAARVLLPDHVRVEARHDLLGIRLAQLAVGFGADTLAGPVTPDRVLPLAGVTRPDEATPTGLATLVRQVGLHPRAV